MRAQCLFLQPAYINPCHGPSELESVARAMMSPLQTYRDARRGRKNLGGIWGMLGARWAVRALSAGLGLAFGLFLSVCVGWEPPVPTQL